MANVRTAIIDDLASQLSGISTTNGYPVSVDLVVKHRVLPQEKISWRHRVILMIAYQSRSTDRSRLTSSRAVFATAEFLCYVFIRDGTFEELFDLFDSIEQAISVDWTRNALDVDRYRVYDTVVSGDRVLVPEETGIDLADSTERVVEGVVNIQVDYEYLPEQIATGA